MKFFSKLRKAKGAAEEYKKAAAAQEEPKPKVPYKHVPTHAAQDALASAPINMGTASLQARIAEAKRTVPPTPTLARSRSMQSMRNYSLSSSRPGSSSTHTSPSHSRASSFGGRSSSDLSIGSVMQSSSTQPSQRDFLSQPYKPTLSAPSAYRPRGYPTNSSRSSMKAKVRSPLATVSINEEDESEVSCIETPASDRSVASSQSSATEISRPNSITEEVTDGVRPALPQLAPAHDEKYESAVEVEPVVPKARGLRRSRSLWSVFGRN